MSVPPEDIDNFMQCPGLAGSCQVIIPKVVTCTGANKGKYYQHVGCLYLLIFPGLTCVLSATLAPIFSG